MSALWPVAALRDLTPNNQQAALSRRDQSSKKAAHSEERPSPPHFKELSYPSLRNLLIGPLLLVQLSPRVQVVEIENRIEHEEITPTRLPAPDRVI